jgi:hypothetical protein
MCMPWAPVAAAGEEAASPGIEQVVTSFERAGYVVDSPIFWPSTGLTTFFVQDVDFVDGTSGRVLLVLTYPDTLRAEHDHRLAHVQEEIDLGTPIANSDERGPALMAGYGRSAWWHNIALVQAKQQYTPRWRKRHKPSWCAQRPAAARSSSSSNRSTRTSS